MGVVVQGLAESERAELEWLLTSGALRRSVNLAKVLRYICEETAASRADHIKEYSIAVEALGRRADFDPQTDTIVRVTIHALRKRLQELYENGEGSSHPVRIVIPPGGYVAHFLHVPVSASSTGLVQRVVEAPPTRPDQLEAPASAPDFTPESPHVPQQANPLEPAPLDPVPSPSPEIVAASANKPVSSFRWWLALLATGLIVLVGLAALGWRSAHTRALPSHAVRPPSVITDITGPMHILLGEGRGPYTDHSGIVWTSRPTCEGGESLRPTGLPIAGTQDAYLFDGGVRGLVRCTLHARPGFYEIHLLFAEPTNLEPAQRVISLSINAGPAQLVDVVDRAGGDQTATTYVIVGVAPENDGSIHLDFTSETSPLNAIEIFPSPTAEPLPVRFVAGPSAFTDDHGTVWLSDRFFRGGRHGQPPDHEHSPLGLYASNRIGSFDYRIPVPVGFRYQVKLYCREAWFGQTNGAPGGVGSRVFDVYINGQAQFRNFDIFAEGGGAGVVKTINGVTPTPGGMLDLHFVPLVNYPLVNAIEILPEGPVQTTPARSPHPAAPHY